MGNDDFPWKLIEEHEETKKGQTLGWACRFGRSKIRRTNATSSGVKRRERGFVFERAVGMYVPSKSPVSATTVVKFFSCPNDDIFDFFAVESVISGTFARNDIVQTDDVDTGERQLRTK